MATNIERTVDASRLRLRRAATALAASITMLAFVVALPPGTGEVAVASASVWALPPGLPAPVAQDVATAIQSLQTPADDGDDLDTTQQQEDQQLQDQLNQQQSDQQQNQLNTNNLTNEELQQDSEQQTQEQNDEAQQQVDDGLQQAQQDELDAGQ